MNITFLIGNGFDLNLGLKTRYSNFLKEYQKPNEKDSDLLCFFKNEVLKDNDLWGNAEEAFGISTKQFKEKGYTAEDFCNCHENFCDELAEYLRGQVSTFDQCIEGREIAQLFAQNLQKYKDSFSTEEKGVISKAENTVGSGIVYNFINFNYTNTLDAFVDSLRKNRSLLGKRKHSNTLYENTIGKLIHVHGTLDVGMVLGVNDVSQISSPDLFEDYAEEYIGELIKQQTNKLNGENVDRNVHELLKSSHLIYIYGMAIGATDRLWWQRICSWLSSNPHAHLIIHKFDAPQPSRILRRYISYTKDQQKKFVDLSDLDDDKKKSIIDRIHIDNSNIFDELKDIAVIVPTNEANVS